MIQVWIFMITYIYVLNSAVGDWQAKRYLNFWGEGLPAFGVCPAIIFVTEVVTVKNRLNLTFSTFDYNWQAASFIYWIM